MMKYQSLGNAEEWQSGTTSQVLEDRLEMSWL